MTRSSWFVGMVCMGGLLGASTFFTASWVQGDEDESDQQVVSSQDADDDADDDDAKTFCFVGSDAGELPKGWTADKTGRGEKSVWRVVADSTSPSKTGYALAQTSKSPGRVFNLCVLDDSNYRDVEVKVSFKAMKGEEDQGGGIVWRYQDANNYYVARMNPLEDNYRFYKVVDGRRSQLATKEGLKVPVGEWHTLEIECVGNKVECELDGEDILEIEDDTFKKSGKVGLWTKADAQTYFDNFVVEEEDADDDEE